MSKYRVVKTVAAKSRESYLRKYVCPDRIVYEIHKKFLGYWFYVDYWYSLEVAEEDVQTRLGVSPSQLRAKQTIPEVIKEWK